MTGRAQALLALCALAFGCAGDPRGPDQVAVSDRDAGPAAYLTFLGSLADIEMLADGDLAVKYLAPLSPGAHAPPVDAACAFQDMHDAVWHVEFLASYDAWADLDLDAYLDLVLRRVSRAFWGGTIRLWPESPHPDTGELGVVSYSVYAEETRGNELSLDEVLAVQARLAGCVGFPELLVFAPEGPGQRRLVVERADDLAAAGIVAADAASLAGDVEFEVYSEGVGYGTLVVVPSGMRLEEHGPRDVVVLESAPNDIGIVAGLVTAQPQNLYSHVNLRLSEKSIPNARIPDATSDEYLVGLAGRLVRIETSAAGIDIVPAGSDEAEAWWEARRPNIGQPVADLDVTDVAYFEALGSDDVDAYGAKAANLAELSNLFAPERAPEGFAIPFAAYRDHLEEHGVDAMIADFLDASRPLTDLEYRRDSLDDIRDAIRDAPIDPALFSEVERQIRDWLGGDAETTRLRFRSSTNVEDLEAITGAGLYDSRSGCLGDDLDGDEVGPSHCLSVAEVASLEAQLSAREAELARHPDRLWLEPIIEDLRGDLIDEKPIAGAITRVWRSLWNDRAWQEREFYGIEHERAYMAIAVNPSFVLERANTVVFTNLDADSEEPLYRIVSQLGTESVVRPADPTAIAEVRTVRRGEGDALVDDTVWIRSSLAGDVGIWPDDDFAALMNLVFEAHDHFVSEVFGALETSLDMEIKLTAEGRVMIKQVRPAPLSAP